MTKEELENVVGGVSWGLVWTGIGAVVTFVLGFIDGMINPIKCGK